MTAVFTKIAALDTATALTQSDYAFLYAAAGATVEASAPVVQGAIPTIVGGTVLSNEFTSAAVALSACPNHTTPCGTQMIVLAAGAS